MATLQQRGLVRIEQGRGTFVHEGAVHYEITRRTRFAQNLLKGSWSPSPTISETEMMASTADVAEQLHLEPGTDVYRIRVKQRTGVSVLSVTDSFFPAARFPNFPTFYTATRSTTESYKNFGINDYVRERTWVAARMPTVDEARMLEQPRSIPIVVSRKLDCDLESKPISYAITLWSADRVEFVIDGLG
ncbi:phosphonate metabolism transcriptional regulator PhnF [Cereibacter sp. SYSU M97828]|nr:phosphonate metabolism transcriptional regulator PhnF [Cereibacter flavus]